MSVLNIQEQLTGGESVYCINQAQMTRTRGLIESSDETGAKLRSIRDRLEDDLDRNELAALAFSVIERLNGQF
jgi:hypothetical protein